MSFLLFSGKPAVRHADRIHDFLILFKRGGCMIDVQQRHLISTCRIILLAGGIARHQVEHTERNQRTHR